MLGQRKQIRLFQFHVGCFFGPSEAPTRVEMVVDLQKLVLAHHLRHVANELAELLVLLDDEVIEVHGLALAANSALLGADLVSQTLPFFDRQTIFFGSLELVLQCLDSILGFDKVHVILLSLATSPFPLILGLLLWRLITNIHLFHFLSFLSLINLLLVSFIDKLAVLVVTDGALVSRVEIITLTQTHVGPRLSIEVLPILLDD